MASKHILVTGGAGFIGSFLVDVLIAKGHKVRIFDNLEPQVHPNGKRPDYLNPKAEFMHDDVTDMAALKRALADVEVVFHEAAMVGVGQSMYQIRRYVDVNTFGTANLLDLLVNTEHNVKKLLVASSMSIYGEGSYTCAKCGPVHPPVRTDTQMQKGDFEVHCPSCNSVLAPHGVSETKPLEPTSIYAITKKDQEDMVLTTGKAYGIPSVALRYFNVYGPRQSLSNPYTGVAAIFMSRIKNNHAPLIFEDGSQSRDFVSVHDIVQANLLAMDSTAADYENFNVGTGNQVSIKQVADILLRLYGKQIKSEVNGKFRKGDIRHCFSDITKIKKALGYVPKVNFEQGMQELIAWAANAEAVDKVEQATAELERKGLM